ncbi:DNA polymerase III subunit delta [soil metagenome]
MIIKSLGTLLHRRDPAVVAILFYGPDAGGVRELAASVVRARTGSLDDPFGVARLDDANLSDDRGRLSDEVMSLPFMGGEKIVWVENAGASFLAALELLLERPATGNLIVAEAGNLLKSAKLRSVFEASNRLMIMPCYEDAAQDLNRLIAEDLEAHGLRLGAAARDTLLDLLGADRRLSRQELEKLALYCLGRTSISEADVLAICGDGNEMSVDEVLNAAFEGEFANLDAALARSGGTQAQGLLAMAGSHLARLTRLRLDVDRGKSAEIAVRAARPPVFFKQQASITRQLRLWTIEALELASHTIAHATLQSRLTPALAEAIAGRALLTIGRMARNGAG